MKIQFRLFALLTAAFLLPALAQDPIELPKPQTDGGRPLMQVLRDRKTTRDFSPEALPPQVLSNLLWAAFGINRPDSGRRTAPSARNFQETDIYVALATGTYLYDAKANKLQPVIAADIRKQTGNQPFVGIAAVELIYVADYARMGGASEADKITYSNADSGFIGQNVYLFCASEGLAAVVRGGIGRQAISTALKLRPEQHITLVHTVGYPKK